MLSALFQEYMNCLNETISVLCSSYHFHLHCDTSLISVDPLWPVFLRYLQISSPGETVQCLYRSILLHSTLRWTKKQIIFFYQGTNEGRQKKKTIFFLNCLLIMHFDLACKMWRVLLRWRRKQSEGDKTTQRCLARCLWTVFFFVILKGTVQWIVQIEECLSYICQCSFYII